MADHVAGDLAHKNGGCGKRFDTFDRCRFVFSVAHRIILKEK